MNSQNDMNKESWVHYISMTPPSLSDNAADVDRLTAQLKQRLNVRFIDMDRSIMVSVPAVLRKSNFNVRCVLFGFDHQYQLIDIQPSNDCLPVYGLAIDLGTTRVVFRLLDLITQSAVIETTIDNPQCDIAPDVLARIHYTDQADGLFHLQQRIIHAINQQIQHICTTLCIRATQIMCVSIAGNTCMTHLLLGLPPQAIIREPYIPVINRQLLLPANELGVDINPRARIFIFPNIGSYFGGDLISGILALDMYQQTEISIMVDVGTNAEVVLGNKDWMIACAGAAGPALESGVSKIGMTAGPGAIERIQPDNQSFIWQTIENKKPVGICGSGFIDLAAVLFQSGKLDIRGKLVPDKCKDRMLYIDNIAHFLVVPGETSATGKNLTISQVDIDSLIRSKAAMYTILTTITQSVGIRLTDISTFYVAGTFGAYIDPSSAITIGMIPDLPLQRYQSVGNTSLAGATRVLLSRKDIEAVSDIQKHITYLELNVNQEFMNRFSAAKFLPHTDTTLFPTVNVPSI